MSRRELKSLLAVLGEIAVPRPRAVLMRGRDYWDIGYMLKRARRDLKAGPPETRELLSAEEYWWDTPDGKVVVWRETPGGPRPIFSEPGSGITAD